MQIAQYHVRLQVVLHKIQKNLSESHTAYNNTLWNFFLIKKSQDIGVKHRWGMDDKKMCVPSITPTC